MNIQKHIEKLTLHPSPTSNYFQQFNNPYKAYDNIYWLIRYYAKHPNVTILSNSEDYHKIAFDIAKTGRDFITETYPWIDRI